jgi:hypothetical protein
MTASLNSSHSKQPIVKPTATKAGANKEGSSKTPLKKSNSQGPFSHLAAAAAAIGALPDLLTLDKKDSHFTAATKAAQETPKH